MSKWLERQQKLEEEEARGQTQYIDALAGPAPFDVGYPGEPTPAPKPGTTYTWMKDDQWPLVAKRLGFSRQELLEHNNITDPAAVRPGDVIHLPVARAVVQERQIRFEPLPEPRDMHVSKPGGCKKWAFGNVRTYDDFKSHGFYPENTNVRIMVVAYVPVDDKEKPDAEVGYYMDDLAFGDYAETGRVRFTVGYRWVDLAEGIAAPPPPKETISGTTESASFTVTHEPKKTMDVAPPAVKHDAAGFDPQFIEQRLEDAINNGAYKFMESYQRLNVPVPCMAMIPDGIGEVDPTGRRFIWVKDFLTKRPDRRLYHQQELSIAATFDYAGQLYGRPEKSLQNHNFFGIPMDFLQSQQEVYNTELDTETRAATGKLTAFERYFWVPVAKLVHKHKNNQNKE